MIYNNDILEWLVAILIMIVIVALGIVLMSYSSAQQDAKELVVDVSKSKCRHYYDETYCLCKVEGSYIHCDKAEVLVKEGYEATKDCEYDIFYTCDEVVYKKIKW